MSLAAWSVRVATVADRGLLARFRCANPKLAWQVEVEHFIQARVLEWALAPGAASRCGRDGVAGEVDRRRARQRRRDVRGDAGHHGADPAAHAANRRSCP